MTWLKIRLTAFSQRIPNKSEKSTLLSSQLKSVESIAATFRPASHLQEPQLWFHSIPKPILSTSMCRYSAYIASGALLLLRGINAFSVAPATSRGLYNRPVSAFSASCVVSRSKGGALYATSEEQAEKDDEIERLKSMAAKLRAEASSLEAERATELAEAAERAFAKFDTNKDGEISLAELKDGKLKKIFFYF